VRRHPSPEGTVRPAALPRSHAGRVRASRSWLALAVALVAALIVAGCRGPGPQWTFAPPSSSPGPVSTAAEGTTAPSPEPSPSASPVGPSPSLQPTPAPSTAPVSPQAGRIDVPILYYHRVIAPPHGFATWPAARQRRFLTYDVLPVAFEAQLDWLVAHDYTTILPRDLAAYWDFGVPLPRRPVIITFDDGTHDWAGTVLRMLEARHMVAEFYVTIDALHSGGMSWPELRRLAAAGNGIGAHGLHHRQLAALGHGHPSASVAAMRRDVLGVRDQLTARLGVVPDSFAYVGGGYDDALRRVVAEAGFTTARSIVHGRFQTPARRDVLRVVRIGFRLDVVSVAHGTLAKGLPGFAALLGRRTGR
jgi:peptidoglycan/xylan/chitin deacetylase (PgdA/CDA1 family)